MTLPLHLTNITIDICGSTRAKAKRPYGPHDIDHVISPILHLGRRLVSDDKH
jgi:hypothetical protein